MMDLVILFEGIYPREMKTRIHTKTYVWGLERTVLCFATPEFGSQHPYLVVHDHL